MCERGGYIVDHVGLLADALYRRGRFDEAQQLVGQAFAGPLPSSCPLAGTWSAGQPMSSTAGHCDR